MILKGAILGFIFQTAQKWAVFFCVLVSRFDREPAQQKTTIVLSVHPPDFAYMFECSRGKNKATYPVIGEI